MNLKEYTTPKRGWMLQVWGGFWNDGVGYELTDIESGTCLWFNSWTERSNAELYLNKLADKTGGCIAMRGEDPSNPNVDKYIVAHLVFVYEGNSYTVTYDAGWGRADEDILYYLTDGNMGCDCNRADMIREHYPEFEKDDSCGCNIVLVEMMLYKTKPDGSVVVKHINLEENEE